MTEGNYCDWNNEAVCSWIEQLGFPYKSIFQENCILGKSLVLMNSNDLRDMGILSIGHRLDILSAIQDLKESHKEQAKKENPLSLKKTDCHEDTNTQERVKLSLLALEKRIDYLEAENAKLVKTINSLNSEFLPLLRKLALNFKETKLINSDTCSESSSIFQPSQSSPTVAGSFDLEVNDQAPLNASEKKKVPRMTINSSYHEVLTSTLQKYHIDPSTWLSYELLLSYDGKEHPISTDVKPLQLFRNLQKHGKSPSFILSRKA
ncbi:adaptor protein Ste4 [Schizosaccharomyces cryophilus OY26]|uniref:Adaptor protein Ste4 n=1 Tax=Schizosaccharomyces cryophilus (strain OY26 / ATCC MYA-4695 / CBS 11777 / NBRC 106824 / NRRL Y48691) TaxID=653667 RepID=S9XAY9_SCHCR|nr:adaptor protein Ste4 [Schizosaccharomyces cryophilus OY26]EPY50901.1 adaptor protein Ste4 [Schizosaccharomyces cryophilus OY26]